jgi:proteic killer suppression protein
MIQSWKDDWCEPVKRGVVPKGFPTTVFAAARRKILQLDAAMSIEDMRAPPGNRLHQLDGDRAGQWSVSVNDQFRLCFTWGLNGPEDVEFVDYH